MGYVIINKQIGETNKMKKRITKEELEFIKSLPKIYKSAELDHQDWLEEQITITSGRSSGKKEYKKGNKQWLD